MINFKCIGKIKPFPKNDKMQPYAEKRFDSGWVNRTLLFWAEYDESSQLMKVQGGHFDKFDYTVITNGKRTTDGKYPKLEIPWKDRNLDTNIEKVAEFKRFLFDGEVKGRRKKLETLNEKYVNGKGITDNDLKQVGLSDASEIPQALVDSNKKKKEFITEWDYAEFLNKVIESGKFSPDTLFYITGTIDCQWSDKDKKWYTNLKPQKIYLADEDAEQYCVGSAKIYFTSDAVDTSSLEEKGKYYITSYTFEYDSTRKTNIPHEMKIVILKDMPNADGVKDDLGEKRALSLARRFLASEGEVKEYGIEFDMISGQEKLEITEKDLTDEQREDLELGIITMDDIRADLGENIYGEKIVENRFKGVMRGYTKGVQPTEFNPSKLVIPSLDDGKDTSEEGSWLTPEEDDLFS